MSSWNDGQDPGQQYGQPAPGQQSLGQGFGQQGGYAPGGPAGPPPGPQGGYQQQAPAPSGSGIADLFSDFGFRKGLTESVASIAFLITVVWAVLRFVQTLANAWGSQDFGDTEVKNMGGFEAMMATLTGLAWLIFVVIVARLFFELCINIARLARDRT